MPAYSSELKQRSEGFIMYQREYEQKLRVGIVGAGSHMYRNLLPAMHYLPMELVAICNRGEEKLQRTLQEYRCAGYTDPATMYKNEALDAVVICVSPQMHPSLAIQAFEHGLHVFMEKPPAMCADEVRAMIAAQGKLCASVGFKKAYMPGTVKAREIAHAPAYGNLQSMLAVYPMSMPKDGAGVLARRDFSNWLGNGCHPLSLLMSVGGRVCWVQTIVSEAGHGAVLLGFESGIIATLQLASGVQPPERYQFFGDKWSLTIDNTDTVSLYRGIPFAYAYTNNFVPEGDDSGTIVWQPQNCLATLENKSLFLQGMVQEMHTFARSVLYGEDPGFTSLPFALEVMKVYEAALCSNGARITLAAETK